MSTSRRGPRSGGVCQNEASIHRTAEEFTDDHKRVREWCQCYSTLKGQTHAECLESATMYAVANLCQSILTVEFLGLWG